MLKRSWFFRNGLFYTLLALVILLHLIFLMMRYQQKLDLSETVNEPPTKVRIMDPAKLAELKKQIAQSEDPATLAKPDGPAYLSDKDRKVDRQTRARLIDSFKQAAKGDGAGPKASERKSTQAPAKSMKDINLSDLGAFSKDHRPLETAAKEYSKNQNSKIAGAHTPRPGEGLSATSDHLEGVPLGDLTYLNTVEYKYYGFFHRIRQKLEQFWGRSIQEKAESFMREGRKIASDENLITSLVVILSEQGEITDIVVKGSSGIKELDDSAVESFNEAGPFPNPPKGLVQNGKVEIEWGFVVDT